MGVKIPIKDVNESLEELDKDKNNKSVKIQIKKMNDEA